ncbi:hypothetical protein BDW02DRAFT_572881 [Decorospora gaudefroyi]|uniref:Uncharacterized protein n=1 Tax=Decorospora gaudefroyi TaxID=184978 RepID=A0A6A5K6X2_9PLEO|nr:hypothetical protein BDW02DRAFT_572881 [Decorospora gaudefroyi]
MTLMIKHTNPLPPPPLGYQARARLIAPMNVAQPPRLASFTTTRISKELNRFRFLPGVHVGDVGGTHHTKGFSWRRRGRDVGSLAPLDRGVGTMRVVRYKRRFFSGEGRGGEIIHRLGLKRCTVYIPNPRLAHGFDLKSGGICRSERLVGRYARFSYKGRLER